jgi:hypothetical protein
VLKRTIGWAQRRRTSKKDLHDAAGACLLYAGRSYRLLRSAGGTSTRRIEIARANVVRKIMAGPKYRVTAMDLGLTEQAIWSDISTSSIRYPGHGGRPNPTGDATQDFHQQRPETRRQKSERESVSSAFPPSAFAC